MAESENHIDDRSFPSLFQTADAASLDGQATHIKWLRIHLIVLVLAAACGIVSVEQPLGVRLLASASAVLFIASLIIGLTMQSLRPTRRWYQGRAVAESAKSMAWKFMTRAEPYDGHGTKADDQFLKDLSDILNQVSELSHNQGSEISTAPQISQVMRDVRKSDTETRKSVYLRDRVEDQREWYARKSRFNSSRMKLFFTIILILQILAVAFSVVKIAAPDFPFVMSGLFATIAAALLTWLQARHHEELAESYSIAAQDLGFAAERVKQSTDDNSLADAISDAENAISREHTMWRARREVS